MRKEVMNMKTKKTLLLATLAMLSFSLVACGNTTSEDKPSENNTADTGKASETTKTDDDKKTEETQVTLTLTANAPTVDLKIDQSATLTNYYTVTKSSGTPTSAEKACTYEAEDPTVIKITNKVMKALKVGSTKIIVTSKKDTTKTCEFTVNVTEVYFDRNYSQVSSEDDFSKELPEDGGIVRTKGSTTADLFVKGVDSTAFIANCTFSLNSVSSSEKFPKLGIVCSTAENASEDTATNNKMYFFLNAEMPNGEATWSNFGICEVQNGANWAWNAGVTNETARHKDNLYVAEKPVSYSTAADSEDYIKEFKLTMVRKNLDFHFFVNDNYAGSCKTLDSLFTNGDVNLSSMVGFFEFNSDVTFSHYDVDVDATNVDTKIASITTPHFLADDEWAAD